MKPIGPPFRSAPCPLAPSHRPRPRASGRLWTFFVVAAGSLAPATGSFPGGALSLEAQRPGLLAWEARAGDPSVAVSIRFPAGALRDVAGGEGTAFLLGRVIEAAAGERLAPYSARLEVEVGLHHVQATLFAPTSTWRSAWEEVTGLLTSTPFQPVEVERARNRLVDELLFQEGSPERAFEAAWNGVRLGGLEPGGVDPARRVEGRISTVSRLDAGTLEGWRRTQLRWEEARMAVVGGVTRADADALGASQIVPVAPEPRTGATASGLPVPGVPGAGAAAAPPDAQRSPPEELTDDSPPLPRAALRIGTPAPPLVLPTGAARPPWTTGVRLVEDVEVTSTWIGVAWALPRGTPWVLADFLGHVLAEALNPSPADPNLYRARVTLEEVGAERLLVVVAATDPQAAYAWEDRIVGSLEALVDNPLPGAFLDLARRRYRSSRILVLADPVQRARWIAQRIEADGSLPSVSAEVWAIQRPTLAALADRAGEPRRFLKGPVRMMDTP